MKLEPSVNFYMLWLNLNVKLKSKVYEKVI